MAQSDGRTTGLLMLGVAVVGANSLALSPILNDVAAGLSATPVAVARASAAYGAATALSALALGSLVDRLGARFVLVRGLLVLAVAMGASAAAPHWAALAAAQALAGAAAGVVLPAAYALATASAPTGRGAEALGRVLTGWSVSLVAGVPASALLADLASWRASFLALAAPLALAAWLLSRQAEPERTAARASGGLGQALRVPGVLPLLAVCLLFMTAFYGVYAYLGDHARRALGLSAAEAGLIVLAYGVGFGLAAAGDRWVDRIGAARLFPAVLAGVGLSYAALIPGLAAFPALLTVAAAWGFANHFGLNILVLRLTEAGSERRGAVLALNSATSYAGAFLGAGLFGVLYERAGFPVLAVAASACAGLAALVALAMLRARGAARPRGRGAPSGRRSRGLRGERWRRACRSSAVVERTVDAAAGHQSSVENRALSRKAGARIGTSTLPLPSASQGEGPLQRSNRRPRTCRPLSGKDFTSPAGASRPSAKLRERSPASNS